MGNSSQQEAGGCGCMIATMAFLAFVGIIFSDGTKAVEKANAHVRNLESRNYQVSSEMQEIKNRYNFLRDEFNNLKVQYDALSNQVVRVQATRTPTKDLPYKVEAEGAR